MCSSFFHLLFRVVYDPDTFAFKVSKQLLLDGIHQYFLLLETSPDYPSGIQSVVRNFFVKYYQGIVIDECWTEFNINFFILYLF